MESIFDRKRTKNKDQLTAKEWQDLIDFEGNAFSVLTASRPGIEGGLFRMQLWCFYEISKEFTKKTNKKYLIKKYVFSNRLFLKK
jgi:dGTPase